MDFADTFPRVLENVQKIFLLYAYLKSKFFGIMYLVVLLFLWIKSCWFSKKIFVRRILHASESWMKREYFGVQRQEFEIETRDCLASQSTMTSPRRSNTTWRTYIIQVYTTIEHIPTNERRAERHVTKTNVYTYVYDIDTVPLRTHKCVHASWIWCVRSCKWRHLPSLVCWEAAVGIRSGCSWPAEYAAG